MLFHTLFLFASWIKMLFAHLINKSPTRYRCFCEITSSLQVGEPGFTTLPMNYGKCRVGNANIKFVINLDSTFP